MLYLDYEGYNRVSVDDAINDCLAWDKKTETRFNTSKADYLAFIYKVKDVLKDITFEELRVIYFSRLVQGHYLDRFGFAIAETYRANHYMHKLFDDIKKNKV